MLTFALSQGYSLRPAISGQGMQQTISPSVKGQSK